MCDWQPDKQQGNPHPGKTVEPMVAAEPTVHVDEALAFLEN